MKKNLFSMLVLCLIGLQSVLAQSREVSGIVTSADDGLSIPGVSVIIKGTTIGITTDFDGKYTIPAEKGQTLVFSFVGMKTTELLADKDVINLVMKSESIGMDEVMVVAYGTAKKESFTGSAAVVKKDDIVKVSGGVAQAIQGKVAGVQVIGDDIRIRGYGSFKASGDPLYVVDGIVGAPTPNTEDIEAFTVLKDASSTALYGSRAANGVIIITTKRGKKDQKPQFNFKYQHGVHKIIDPDYDLMNAQEHFQTTWKGIRNQELNKGVSNDAAITEAHSSIVNKYNGNNPFNMDTPLDNNGMLRDDAALLYSTDWQDAGLQDGSYNQYDLSVTGGSDKSSYYWSLGYKDYEGLAKIDKDEQFSTLFNFSSNLTDNIEVGVNSNLKYKTFKGAYTEKANENNLIYVTRVLTPVAPLYQQEKVMADDGTWTYIDALDANGQRQYDWTNPNYKDYNPIGQMKVDPSSGYGYRMFVAPWIRVKLAEGLSFYGNAAARLNTDKEKSVGNALHGSSAGDGGMSTKESMHSRKFNTHGSFTYKFDLNEDHHFEVLAGAEMEDYTYEWFSASTVGYPLGDVSDELSIGQKPKYTYSSTTETGVLSFLSQVKYNYLDRYYIDGSFRRDGSSKFGENKRWGNFWSVGASWRVSEESFLKDVEWVDNLKFRVSYGVTGTDAIGSYKYGDYYSLGSNYNRQTGIVHSSLPNPNLGWEQNNSLSTGIEFALFNTLSGSLEFYNKKTTDLLFNVPKAYTTGFDEIFMNIGEMQNRGVEFELSNVNIQNDTFTWTTSITATYNKNTIESLPQDEIINGSKRYRVGGSLYDYYIRKWAGVDANNGDALWYKKDGSTTNDYDDADKFNVGRSVPDVVASMSNSFTYKGFDLSFQIYASIGGKVYDGAYASLMHDGSDKVSQLSTDALKSWKKKGDKTNVPKYVYESSAKSNSMSTRFLYDGTFVKLKNISLGYKLPKHIVSRFGLKSARVFGTVDNLLTISDFKSGDPEMRLSGNGVNYKFPNTTTWRVGASIKF